MKKSLVKASRFMSMVLRHKPHEIGAELDENGWLSVEVLLEGMRQRGYRIGKPELYEIVETNDKKRFAFNESKTKIRANQGHSVEVDVELNETEPPEYLFHGTVSKSIPAIREKGLSKMSRQHVHLSKDRKTAEQVGARRGKPIILTIQSGAMYRDGIRFWLSQNGVWLTDNVDPKYIEFK